MSEKEATKFDPSRDSLTAIPRSSITSISGDKVASGEISKIKIHFIAVGGDTSALTKPKILLSGTRLLYDAEKALKSKLPSEEAKKSFYFHCGSSFCPTPDQSLQDLFDCFQIGGELVLQYGIREVWG